MVSGMDFFLWQGFDYVTEANSLPIWKVFSPQRLSHTIKRECGFIIFGSIRSTQYKRSRPVISIHSYSKLRLLIRSTNRPTGGSVGVLILYSSDCVFYRCRWEIDCVFHRRDSNGAKCAERFRELCMTYCTSMYMLTNVRNELRQALASVVEDNPSRRDES